MAASEKKMSIFFLIKQFHHLLKTYFGSEFGKVLFYLLLYYHRFLAFSFLKRKKKCLFTREPLCIASFSVWENLRIYCG